MAVNIEKSENEVLGVVIYTDGSVRPTNPGSIGWGAHGYIYRHTPGLSPLLLREPSVSEEEQIITDHGYVGSARLKHITDLVRNVEPLEYFDFLGSSLETGTNNIAEIKAFYYTLENLKLHASFPKLSKISIFSDSEYLKKGLVDFCRTWEYNAWKKPDGQFVANHEWWIKIYAKYREIKASGVDLTVNWVKGHNDVFGNIQADVLAGIAANYSMAGIDKQWQQYTPAKTYWKLAADRHPLFCYARIYFNSVPQYNQPGVYYQADPGVAEHLIGRRTADASFCVLRMKAASEMIDAVKTRQIDASAGQANRVVMLKTDRIYQKNIYRYMRDHGGYALNPNRKTHGLDFFDRSSVTVEQDPTGLSLRAIDNFNMLEDLLSAYTEVKSSDASDLQAFRELTIHDITGVFFDKVFTKKKGQEVELDVMRPEFVPGFRDLKIPVTITHKNNPKQINIPIIMGLDTPPRNNLKRLEDLKPHLDLITWRVSDVSIRYAVVVSCTDGTGIWSNFFSDRIFLRD